MVRRPSRAVELEDIISSEIIGDDPEIVSAVLNTHLALEAILIEMLGLLQAGETRFGSPFPAKTKWLQEQGILVNSDKAAFDRFNEFRNDLAHIFGHKTELVDVLKLARELESFGIDFSDSVGHYSEIEATEYYGGAVGVLAEIGWCILFHAAYILQEAGGRDIFSADATE